MSVPSKRTRPLVAGSSRMMICARVDLPQPLSPTRPSTAPRSTRRLTSLHGSERLAQAKHARHEPPLQLIDLGDAFELQQRRHASTLQHATRRAALTCSGGRAAHCVDPQRTARHERASGPEPARDRRRTFDRMDLSGRVRKARHAGEQRARVGLARRGEQRRDRRLLHQHAAIQDDGAAAHLRHEIEIVRDEQQREAEPLAQILQQADDLRLHGDVERGGRLIGDQQARPACDRHGDEHALAHAAGELVRILAQAAAPVRRCRPSKAPRSRSLAPRRGRRGDAP